MLYNKLINEGLEIDLADILGLIQDRPSNYEEIPIGISSIEDLLDPGCIQALRRTLLDLNIDYTDQGLRLVIDLKPGFGTATYITTKPVAAQNFTDWLKRKEPWTPGRTGGFFEKCAHMALGKIPSDRPLTFLDERKTVFAINDDHPKAPFHKLILTTVQHDNLLDHQVTLEEWQDIFSLAYTLFNDVSLQNQDMRLIFNCGQGLQRGNWLNAHLLADKELMHFDPAYYGFTIDTKNFCIQAETENELYLYLKQTIAQFEQANTTAEKIRLGQALKSFLNSRVMFH